MPPRRAPKVGTRRIDAALDSIRPMGFPATLIRKTIRNLLKAYGGDVGWPFIEENSYELVIKSILEEQEKPEGEDEGTKFSENFEPKLLIGNEVSKDNITGEKAEEKSDCSRQVQSPGIESPPGKKPSNSSSPVAESVHGNLKGETFLVQPERKYPSLQISALSSPQLFSPSSCPPRKRKPCYGWLSSDDEEEEPKFVNEKSSEEWI